MIDRNDRILELLRDLEALCGVAMSLDFDQLRDMAWHEQEGFKKE